MKLDDDNCMDPEKLSQGIEKHEKEHNGTALYGGSESEGLAVGLGW